MLELLGFCFIIYKFGIISDEKAGVYIITNAVHIGNILEHDILYIGVTKNIKKQFTNHYKNKLFEGNNANYIWFYEISSKNERKYVMNLLISILKPKLNYNRDIFSVI